MSRRPCGNCRHCDRLDEMDGKSPVLDNRGTTKVQCAGDHSLGQSKNQPIARAIAFNAGNLADLVNSPNELNEYKLNDDDLKPVMNWLEYGEDRPQWEVASVHSGATKAYWAQWKSLRIEEGLLIRLWETPSGDSVIKQIVIPRALRRRVLESVHGTISTGHFGVAKTLGRVKERFYWVNYQQDVREWCEKCDICARRRGPQRRPKAAMKKYVVC